MFVQRSDGPSRKRPVYLAVIAVLALAAGLLVSDGSSQATSFRPLVSPVTLSSETLGANADITIPFEIQDPDSNFGAYVVTLNSPEFPFSDVTPGKTVGYLLSNAILGLLNQGCFQPVTVNFRLVDASVDNSPGNLAAPTGTPDSPLLNYTQDDGDIDNDTVVDDPARANNGIADGAEWYPEFLDTLFSGQAPSHRYFGWQTVPGTNSRVTIQIALFAPGALHNVPAVPSSDLLTAAQGAPSVIILNDPTAVPPQTIEDFCTPLVTETTLCGVTDDVPDNPQGTVPDCDVGASSEVRSTNPNSSGTYDLRSFDISQRDADDDGIENSLDTCPLSGNPDGWDPRASPTANQLAGADDDGDNIANTCDPQFNNATDPDFHDEDQDGWFNRIDNCPNVANVSSPMTTPNQDQLDFDISDGSAVPDGGPPIDFIGPECDPNPTDPDGHYHSALTIYRMCLAGADADGDGVCDDYPGEDNTTDDTDGDGVLDRLDNCIARANANPAGLTQMTPDFNGNGVVQIDDVTYVAGKFGKGTGDNGFRASAEVGSQNGIIQIDDVTAVAGAFGASC